MHSSFDDFAKNVFRKLFSDRAQVRRDEDVSVDSQRIDVRITPSPDAGRLEVDMGLLGRIAERQSIIEVYRAPPSFDEIRDCVRKLLGWHHLQVRQARGMRRRGGMGEGMAADRPDGLRGAARSPEIPTLWILAGGRTRGAIEQFGFKRLGGWPQGTYTTRQPAIPVRFIPISELPRVRSTLLVRLLGRGATLREALDELSALPADSVEHRHISPLVIELSRRLSTMTEKRRLTTEEQEILVTGERLIKAIETKSHQQGMERGLQQGMERGLQQGMERGLQQGMERGRREGIAPTLRQIARKLGRALTEREEATLLRRFDKLGPERLGDVVLDLDAAALAVWLANPRSK